ncbi:hypothetical protein CMUS01_12396 [Colletotrichum musicola]|uniref:Uncharacterized protein n=1 Tax=Colletotrichum musicola TaxID=2175873 RepID=A0A8H6N133_9PEZI|nr:hypothetical protein CMUS01_12396 [Colletotrichum musicola]
MVNAVMQSHRQGTAHYTVEDLKSIEEFRVHDMRVNYTSRCVIANGKLLLRTVLALFPCEGGAKEQTASAPALLMILRKNRLEACCEHVSWAESYPTIFHPQPNPKMPSDADPMPITNGSYVWNSRRKKTLRGPYAADLKQCRECRTSYTFIVKDLDGVRRVVCLVSYKDLGSGDHQWGTHLWCNKPGEHPKVRRRERSVRNDWAWQTCFMPGSDVKRRDLEDWCFGSLVDGSRQ